MQVIHFTEGATDPMSDFGAQYVRFVSLATGRRDSDPTVLCFQLHRADDRDLARLYWLLAIAPPVELRDLRSHERG